MTVDTVLTLEDFEPHMESGFTIVHDGDLEIVLTLVEATPIKIYGKPEGMIRKPFSLLFQSIFQDALEQRLFRLRHDVMGDLEIFLVPTARNETGIQYLATFN